MPRSLHNASGVVKVASDLPSLSFNFKRGTVIFRVPGRIEVLATARIIRIELCDENVNIVIENFHKRSADAPSTISPIALATATPCERKRNGSVIIKQEEFDVWLVAQSTPEYLSENGHGASK